jgi:pyridoxal phosphate enzyme (YggS family)
VTALATGAATPERLAELEHNLTAVRRTIADGCVSAGRDPGEVTLVAITKTFPESDVRALAALGVTDIGENRENELKRKAVADIGVTWHFVGQLQSNKARSIARYADVVHSVDRESLVTALSKARAGSEPLRCLIQVALSDEAGRGGVVPEGVPALAERIAAADGLELGGVMAVAPLGADPDRAFAELAGVAAALRADHPGATWVSAGMSGDLAVAVRHGATHVRIGRALLGTRPPAG